MFPADATLAAAAQALGRHALPWFFAVLLVLLGATVAGARALRRRPASRGRAREAPLADLALRFGAGFGVIVAAALVFAALAEAVEAGKVLGRLDLALSDAVRQGTPEAAVRTFGWITHLGDPATITVLCIAVAVALVVRGRRALALGWVIAVAGNAALNSVLKAVFERARPVHDQAVTLADGWSFPSGHASAAVVAYGMLAYVLIRSVPRAWHLPALLLAVTAAFAVGCSRVFLQVHYATDVAAGFASGTAWLACCIASMELRRHYRRNVS
jgi:membrane-associated phospholipid phosphatase